MHLKGFFKKSWEVLSCTFGAFSTDRAMKMSASLAYYTIFSLAPLLIVLISAVTLIYGQTIRGKANIEEKVFTEISKMAGHDAAVQIREVIQKVSVSEDSTLAAIIGAITLFIGATGVFLEIQDSINMIWRVRAKPKKGWLKFLMNRLLSFSMIIGLGFLLIVSLIANALILALSEQITSYFPQVTDYTIHILNIVNLALTFTVISSLFAIIFKFLPDVIIKWRDVRVGAIVTALLFMLGRFLIGLYIEKVGPGTAYGAAGSLIVILVWVYYSSAILYFGAEFTQVYAEKYGHAIRPATYAVLIVQKEVEKEVDVLPPQNEEKKPS